MNPGMYQDPWPTQLYKGKTTAFLEILGSASSLVIDFRLLATNIKSYNIHTVLTLFQKPMMHLYTLLPLTALATLAIAGPIPEPEAEPQLPGLPVPGLPTGLPASITSKVLSLIPAATSTAGAILGNVANPVTGSGQLGVNVPNVPVPIPGVSPPAAPGLPNLPNLGGSVPGLPNLPSPGVPGGLPNIPSPGVPGLPSLPSPPGVPGLANDPKQLIANVQQAIQILQILYTILLKLPVGVGVGSGNPVVQTLLALIVPLITGATKIPINNL
ncbi:MAG: hypothetical protein Q9182_005892 [Xanthomendoza sp. 2 TL-2023]